MTVDFVKKQKAWVDCLVGRDRNSVFNQIHRMVWNAAVFNVINEGRRTAPLTPEGGPALNGMVHRFIDQCFFQNQMVAIRRLVDKGGLHGRRGIYSLGSLIADMMQHVHLLTRCNLMTAAGLPMDPDPIRNLANRYIEEHCGGAEEGVMVPPELDYERIEERHAEIDKLCGVRPNKRAGGDTVKATFLCAMLKKLDGCRAVATHVNKFIAHAATPESRSEVKADEARLTLKHLRAAHEVICRVAVCLDRFLLTGACHGFVAMTSHDQFQYMDRPFVTEQDVDALRERWNRFDEETQTWNEGNLEWLVDEKADGSDGAPQQTE